MGITGEDDWGVSGSGGWNNKPFAPYGKDQDKENDGGVLDS